MTPVIKRLETIFVKFIHFYERSGFELQLVTLCHPYFTRPVQICL